MTQKEQAVIAAGCTVHLERFLKEFGADKIMHTVKKDDAEIEYIILDEIKEAIKMLYAGGNNG